MANETPQGMGVAIAVSGDTNIYSLDDIMWAVTTSVNPDKDILNSKRRGCRQTFMSAECMTAGDREWTTSNTRDDGRISIDATVPYGYEEHFMRPAYAVNDVRLEEFFSKEQPAAVQKHLVDWTDFLVTIRI